MGVYNGEPKASHCKRPYRSEANIFIALVKRNNKLNAKYFYAIRSLDMHVKAS